MKNLYFVLAFLLVGTFAFANVNENENNESFSSIIIETVSVENLTAKTYTLRVNENLLSHTEMFIAKICHVTIKGTINGKEVDIDVTFTSDSGSCIKDTIKLLEGLAGK